jgi:hypothetical protein
MAAAPALPPSFLAGYAPEPSDFDNWIQTPFSFLTERVVARIWQTGSGQSMVGGSYNALFLNTVLEDPYGGWSTVGSGSQVPYSYLVPYDGWYNVTIIGAIAAVAAHLEPCLTLSGVTLYEMGGGSTPASQVGVIAANIKIACIGGLDYIAPTLWCSANATTSVTPGRNSAIQITWISN